MSTLSKVASALPRFVIALALLMLCLACEPALQNSQDKGVILVASRSSIELLRVDLTSSTSSPACSLIATPLSLDADPQSGVLYAGTPAGLVAIEVPSCKQSLTSAAPGVVLAISAAGGRVLVSDRTTNRFFIFNPQTRAVAEFSGTALAGDFSTDGRFAYIAGDDTLYSYSANGSLHAISVPDGAWGVHFVPGSSLAYIAGRTIQARDACDDSIRASIARPANTLATTADPLRLISLFIANVSTWADTSLALSGTCPQTVTQVTATTDTGDLATIQPLKLVALTRHRRALVLYYSDPAGPLASSLGVPFYDFSAHQAGKISLTGTPHSVVAAALDSNETRVYIGTSGDSSIHVIDADTQSEISKIALSLLDSQGRPAAPDFIVPWPK